MFTSSADLFRTRQAVSDLREVVQFHRDAVDRIGRSGAERAAIAAVISAGGLIPPEEVRTYTLLLQAAALPDDDFNGFVVATAILLLDRLQLGGGDDDLYWNYDAFSDHYRLADPPVRAALMNAFRIGAAQGRVKLPVSPADDDCLTRRPEEVVEALEAAGEQAVAGIIRADPAPDVAGRLWSEAEKRDMAWPLHAAFRYLYERPLSMTPGDPEAVALIPWP